MNRFKEKYIKVAVPGLVKEFKYTNPHQVPRIVTTIARKSIASFKLREGNKVGTTVTLRGDRAEEFLDQVVSIVLPRIRDFRGISDTAFDPFGNYSLGLNDHSIFPQIPYEEVGVSHGFQINIVTTAKSAAEGKKLLELMGFPFRRNV
jgi:large subunit ribosomal protein L5